MRRWKTQLVLNGLVAFLVVGIAICRAANPVGFANPTIGRNLANTAEKGILADFSVKKGAEKNIKWSAVLGSKGAVPAVVPMRT